MAGVTDLPFRSLARARGAALTFTEMIKDRALLHGNDRTLQAMTLGEDEQPVGVQLLGSEAAVLAAAARRAEAGGAALVDLNLGCPVPKVVRNGEGAALLADPDHVARIVEAMVKAVTIPVTVKLRRGLDSEETAPDVARRAVAAGAAAVTVHGRFRNQYYSGQADWGVIARVREAIRRPVIGNGDVLTGADARRLLQTTGCEAVMIGRAALGRPWVFREISDSLAGRPVRPVTSAEQLSVALEHLRGLIELKGTTHGVLAMRKHAAWYIRGLPGAVRFRRRLFQAASPADMERLLREALEG